MVLLQPSMKSESQRYCGWNPVSRAAVSTGLERRRPEPVAGVGPEIAPGADFGSARSGHGVVESLLQRAALRHYVGEARHDVPIQPRPRRTACRGAHDAAGLTGGASISSNVVL